MKNSFYTIMYDETKNASNKKELQIIVRYWSEVQNCVRSSHLKTMFIGSATAETIFKNLTDTMDEMKLPRSRLLMLGSDGPYVNKKVHRLMNEEMMLVCERKLVDTGTCNIDIYWGNFLSLKTSLGELKYPLVSAVVKATLVLSHDNAEVKRGFSASGRALTEDKASMSERTLSSIMTIKSILKNFNNKPELVPITKELLSYARAAYSSYENYLAEQKKLKEVGEERKRDEEERKCKDQENKEKALKDKKDIKNCQEVLKEKREKEKMKRKTADSLFEEATKRLKLGVENKNFQEIQIAQAMLQGVATVRKEEDAEREKGDKIQKTLEKKKSTLIENYF